MTNTRIAVLAAVVAAVIAAWFFTGEDAGRRSPGDGGDRPTDSKIEVVYPPPLPQYPETTGAVDPFQQQTKRVALCGYGSVDPEWLPAELDAAADGAILRAAKQAEESGQDRRKALGLSIRALIAAEAADRAVTAEDPVTCHETPLCDERSAMAFGRAAEPVVQASTRLALSTRDPQAYVNALRLCHSIVPDAPPPEGCGALSVESWAQLDEGNALPWLLMARTARRRNDSASFDYAMSRASGSRFFERRTARYGELFADTDLGPAPVRALIVSKLLVAEERFDPVDPFSHFSFLFRYCDMRSLEDPARRNLCGNLRQILVEHSPDVLGAEVAQLIAVPRDAATGPAPAPYVLPGSYPSREDPRPRADDLGCGFSERGEAWLRGVARQGELAYRRSWIESRTKR